MQLNQPYYIENRVGDAHLDLAGKWDFFWSDTDVEIFENSMWSYSATLPNSVYYCLNEAGVLNHPYYGCNSHEYNWVDEKVWYFRKKITLSKKGFDGNAFLCFEGIAYYSKIWVNGTYLGDHEGMHGGPCVDIAEYLNFDGENEIVVEVKACNYGNKLTYREYRIAPDGGRAIQPWNIVHDDITSNGDFILVGIWNTLRIEFLNKIHISRPYLVTESIENNKAQLRLELQIADGRIKELVPFHDKDGMGMQYINSFYLGLTGETIDDSVDISVVIKDEDGIAYESCENVALIDFNGIGGGDPHQELQFYTTDIAIDNPKLWYPNGMGEAHLYTVELTMLHDGKVVDAQSFEYGIRTFTSNYTKGKKYKSKWGKFLYSVNGKQIFLKGMNWTPMDYLYSIDEDRYKWCLTLAKNAGIQLIRVWNGGGYPEADAFYKLCDKLGIMVWQDMYIANLESTINYPQPVVEALAAYNIYRTRNHPSLVIHCGGNEYNPYSEGNAATMFVMKRTVEDLDPSRFFYNTTPDHGSLHVYRNFEPVWYRHLYKDLPFLAESGIHSFPNFVTFKKYISEKETIGVLPDLSSPEFAEQFPDLLNHFSEYAPSRIPQMTSRISQIGDISKFTLADLCEASHVQTYEFYQLMIQSFREIYPICGGTMPWVFKRPWPTVAIQTVDGDDRPTYAYYSVKNAYSKVNACYCQKWSILAPGESIELVAKVFDEDNICPENADLTLTVYNPDLTVAARHSAKASETEFYFGEFKLNDSFTNACFLISVDVVSGDELIARSVYFNKCTDVLGDKEFFEEYRKAPKENIIFKNGPWLKDDIKNAKNTVLCGKVIGKGTDDFGYQYTEILIENAGEVPAYPVVLNLTDESKRFFLSDNFFMITPGEKKCIRITCDSGNCGEICVSAWNSESIVL